MLTQNEIETLSKIIDLSSNLLGVCLTLVALIPVSIGLLSLNSDFISMMENKNELKNIMLSLATSVVLFAIVLVAGMLGKLLGSDALLFTASGLFVIGLVVLVHVACKIVWSIRKAI